MTKVNIVVKNEGEWEEVREIEMPAVPCAGELLLFDEPEQDANMPVGEHEVVQVKHYHYWKHPELSEVSVFVRGVGAGRTLEERTQ